MAYVVIILFLCLMAFFFCFFLANYTHSYNQYQASLNMYYQMATQNPFIAQQIPQPEPIAIPEPSPAAEPAAEPKPKRPANPFLSKDPKQKARRLARALVSDMIVYQPQKRQDALAAGNLKEAFDEEINKSWEEYVEQIGEEMANSTDFFKEALNDILAGGNEVF